MVLARARDEIEAFATREWGASHRLAALCIKDLRRETRLKFNAPAEVEVLTAEARFRGPNGVEITGEIEAFWWLADDLWEISESRFA